MPTDRTLPAALNPRSRFSLVVAVAGLGGAVAFFLPFAYSTSPFEAAGTLWARDAFFRGLWHLGVPAVLPILIAAASIRWIASGRCTRAECLVGYLAAFAAASCLLSLYFVRDGSEGEPSTLLEWLLLVFTWVGPAAGVLLLWRNSRRGVRGAPNAIMAMQIVYVVVAVYGLVGFGSSGLEIGGWLTVVTTAAYLAQICAVSAAAPSLPSHGE